MNAIKDVMTLLRGLENAARSRMADAESDIATIGRVADILGAEGRQSRTCAQATATPQGLQSAGSYTVVGAFSAHLRAETVVEADRPLMAVGPIVCPRCKLHAPAVERHGAVTDYRCACGWTAKIATLIPIPDAGWVSRSIG